MSLQPLNIEIMPSESSFKKHAEAVRDALKNFSTIRNLKAPALINTAVVELIDSTIAFNPFIPFFMSHDLFQELVPAVFNVLNDFATDNPAFMMPKSMDKVSVLNNRVRGSFTQTSSKKGTKNSSFFLFYFY